jgi:hypothetical protein
MTLATLDAVAGDLTQTADSVLRGTLATRRRDANDPGEREG